MKTRKVRYNLTNKVQYPFPVRKHPAISQRFPPCLNPTEAQAPVKYHRKK